MHAAVEYSMTCSTQPSMLTHHQHTYLMFFTGEIVVSGVFQLIIAFGLRLSHDVVAFAKLGQ